jgi:hypothetical protein
MRYLLLFSLLLGASLATSLQLGADNLSLELIIKDHEFMPPQLTIPADKSAKLILKVLDLPSMEFGGSTGGEKSVELGPLKAGTYALFHESHDEPTNCILIVK